MSKKTNNKKNVEKTGEFQVNVVIPVYSNYEILPRVLETLRVGFQDVKYNIYLTDDCSPEYNDKGREFYSKLKNDFPEIQNVLVHYKNQGYGSSVNDSAILGKAEYLLILNSDVIFTENSARYMYQYLHANRDEVAVVFPKSLFFPNSNDPRRPAGKVQHAGMAFDFNGWPYHIFMGWSADHPLVNIMRDFNICSGVCFMIQRKYWMQLKGYDLNYGRGYFEDVDLMLRLRIKFNKTIRYLPMCTIYHYTNASFEKAAQIEKTPVTQMKKNYQYFREKFGDNILFDSFLLVGY